MRVVHPPRAALAAVGRLYTRLPWGVIWRRSSAFVALCLTVLIAAGFRAPAARHITTAPTAPAQRTSLRVDEQAAQQPVVLTPAVNAPEPLAQLSPVPVRPHEVFGFAPYWTLDAAPGFDLHSITTVAYFGVDVNPDGTVLQSGDGWTGYQSQQLVDLITAAHADGDRVVLTAENFDQSQLHQLVRDPQAPTRLAGALSSLLQQKSLDGVNLDFEGTDGGDRALYTAFASSVAHQLKQANPKWQLTVDTYGGSAGDSSGYMDVPDLAAAFDALFVMAYDMYSSDHASPNASLGEDLTTLANYTTVIPASKVILGLPYYGYDFPTADGNPFSKATGAPSPITYGQMEQKSLTVYWDKADATPWAAYKDGSQWHEIYFDNPTSLSMKARAADEYGVSNVGIWALGFDGNDPAMLAAVHGVSNGATGASGPQASPSPTAKPAPKPAPSPSGSGGGSGGSGGGSGGGGGGPLPPPPSPPPAPSPSPCPSPGVGGVCLPSV